MGNTSPKLPTPAATSPMKVPESLQEEITCSICLEAFKDPVSIDCGHNFCRVCLSAHWSTFSPHGYLCPECRHPCSRERMKADTRLRNLVEKIGQLPLQAADIKLEVPTVPQQPGQPVQLVDLDEDGQLCLNERTLSSCLEQGLVKDAPICLISILGEQRRGKSFLQNFVLRRLQNLGAEEGTWIGQEDEPLTGFEWQPGPKCTTKGVWIWNQPFWVPCEQGKVAIFLMDTEGSLDLERSKEDSIKLSAFSMLLSSFQILNLSAQIKETDLDYLEMFVYAAEIVGHTCNLKPIQRLDVLLRDWVFPPVYGLQKGQEYLQDVIKKLEADPCRHSKALETLKNKNTHCYLMPYPGKKLVMGTGGTVADMDEDFRECLEDYVNGLIRSATNHVKKDQEGAPLTGAQLAARIKNFSSALKNHQFGFSTPLQMAIRLHNLETKEALQKEFALFIKEQDEVSRPLLAGLQVTPKSMARRLLEKQEELVTRSETTLQGDETERADTKFMLESCLRSDAEYFLDRYSGRYKSHALKAGVAVGVGAVGLAGGVIGAGVAGAILAAEAIVLSTSTTAAVSIGALAGTGTFAIVGGGLGAGIGNSIGKRKALEAQNMTDSSEELEEGDDLSERGPLLGQQDTS